MKTKLFTALLLTLACTAMSVVWLAFAQPGLTTNEVLNQFNNDEGAATQLRAAQAIQQYAMLVIWGPFAAGLVALFLEDVKKLFKAPQEN